jgi:SAM-dependent methyltransferase
VDLVISNCVINLSEDKEAVFREIFRVLKPGGELFFSDVFSLRRIPEELKKDKELLGECLSGALYVEDFRRLLIKLGYPDYRVYSEAPLIIDKKEKDVYQKIGMIPFTSMTVRAFKCDFEDRCEEYGHVAYYLGTMDQAPHEFKLEEGKTFIKGLPLTVCGNSAQILTETRFSKHFKVVGDFKTHYGLFSSSRDLVEGGCADSDSGGGCC